MKALVTGANGLVGAALVSLLLAKGYEVAVFVRRFDTKFLSDEEKEKVQYCPGDLSRFEHVLTAVQTSKPDVIFHVAAMLSVPSEADPQTSIATNAGGAYYILEAARLFNIKQVIFSSSMGVYGEDIKNGIKDDYTVQRPTTIYGVTKSFAENLGRYYRRKYGIDFRCLRYPSISGPGAKVRHVSVHNSWMIEKSYYGEPWEIFVTPETNCNVLYYKDAAYVTYKLHIAPKEDIKTVCYNIVGIQLSAGEFAEIVSKKLPQGKLTFAPEEPIMNFYKSMAGTRTDCANAEKEWGYAPSYTLDEIIDDFCKVLDGFKKD